MPGKTTPLARAWGGLAGGVVPAAGARELGPGLGRQPVRDSGALGGQDPPARRDSGTSVHGDWPGGGSQQQAPAAAAGART